MNNQHIVLMICTLMCVKKLYRSIMLGAAKQTHSCLKKRHAKHAPKFERLKQQSTPLEVTTTLRHGNATAPCDMHATTSFGLHLTHVHLNMQMLYVLIKL